MKHFLMAAMVLGLFAAQPATARQQSIDGDWTGPITTGGASIRLVLHFGEKTTFDSPDQNARGMAATLKRDGDHVVVEVPVLHGKFDLTLSADGQTLTGVIDQGGVKAPITMKRGQAEARIRPQTPAKPYPYREVEAAYASLAPGGVKLAGTLTVPQGKGPFPAVLLITGSGTQDRDETIFEHKPFLIIADNLTRRGVAVLRVDDRGIGGSTALPNAATLKDKQGDIEAGLAWLRTRPEIDGRRIGLLGHSEGGVLAAALAAKHPDIAFVVLMASPGVRGDAVIVEQSRQANLAAGIAPAFADVNAQIQRRLLDAVMSDPDPAKALAAIQAQARKEGLPPASMAQLPTMADPAYISFITADPGPDLRAIKAPVLAVNGSKDLQVTAAQNLPPIKAANRKAETVELPGLNHLFQTAKTGAPSEYAAIEETIAPSALKLISDWIVKTAKP